MLRASLIFILTLASATAYAATFVVDVVTDSVDAMAGDGVCTDTNGQCSLRAAVMGSNALAGADTASVPTGTFALTIAGAAEDASATGDLDVTDDLVLSGAGDALTIIDGGALDRVLELRSVASRTIAIENLTLRNGRIEGDFSSTTGGAGLTIGTGVAVELAHVAIRDNHVATSVAAAGIGNEGCLHGRFVRILDNTDPSAVGSGLGIAGGLFPSGTGKLPHSRGLRAGRQPRRPCGRHLCDRRGLGDLAPLPHDPQRGAFFRRHRNR